MDIEQLEHYTALRCVPHYDYGIFTRFLVICQFFPLYLTIGLYAITVIHKQQEIYYRFFSTGVTLNWLLNWALQYIIQEKPHIQGCGDGYSMPSWHAQHVFFFYTMITTHLLFKKKRLGTFNLVLLNAVPALVCVARLVLGFSTFTELMIGNIVGVAFAFIYQLFLLIVVQPHIPWLLTFSIVKYLGYTDNLFDSKKNDDPEELVVIPIPDSPCDFCRQGIIHEIHY